MGGSLQADGKALAKLRACKRNNKFNMLGSWEKEGQWKNELYTGDADEKLKSLN